jgi:hypothetical protein
MDVDGIVGPMTWDALEKMTKSVNRLPGSRDVYARLTYRVHVLREWPTLMESPLAEDILEPI